MKRQTWSSSFFLRCSELWGEPSIKIGVGFGIVVVAGFLAFAFGFMPDLWNRHGFGQGWECTSFGKGAYSCAKDVPRDWQKPRKSD